jgi:glycosyltransferase involved in cell wall biosynthesis
MTGSVLQGFQQRVKVNGYVIPNPVAAAPVRAATSASAKERERTVIAMGRLSREKGFDLLLEAFSRIAGRHPGWQLKILGEGPLRTDLEAQAAGLNLGDRVQFTGAVSEPYSILSCAGLFVFSSRFEGFGNALCEAMACGLPVVSFDCPSGPREIVRDGVDGVLVPAENIGELAAAMDRLMSDPQERMHLASKAPEVIERFGLKRVLHLWTQLFEQLVPNRS